MALQFPELPYPDIAEPSLGDSRGMLFAYIGWLEDFLRSFIEFADAVERDGVPYFEGEIMAFYPAAYEEAREQDQFGLLRNGIEQAPDEWLVRCGLAGRQLAMKWKIHHVYIERLRNAFDHKAREFLARLLSSVNSLLKSILKVVPGGGALDELKEAIENARYVADNWDEGQPA